MTPSIRISAAIVLLFIVQAQKMYSQNAVTYELNNGRLGDHLLAYIKAKWISFHYNIPLLYKPFEYSQSLCIHTHEKQFKEKINKKYDIKKIYTTDDMLSNFSDRNTLFIANLKFHAPEISNLLLLHQYILNNENFFQELKLSIKPVVIETNTLPETTQNMITIAVHIRTGGGYAYDRPLVSEQVYPSPGYITRYTIKPLYISRDKSEIQFDNTFFAERKMDDFGFNYSAMTWKETNYLSADKEHPKRFPPLQFYIDQINYLHRKFYNMPLFIHIFTDHANPQELVDSIKQQVDSDNIRFHYRNHSNTHDSHVIEDLFMMMPYDCLIRPASSYSKVAQLLGDHKVIIYPKSAIWLEEYTLFINEVDVIFKTNSPF